MDLNTLISQYGYAALVIGSLAEGETVTLLGGVAAHQGLLKFPLVVLSVAFGGMIGDQVLYLCGGGLAASCYAVSRNIRIKLSGRRNLSNAIRICLSLVRALCMAFG
ncbi:DedA family membrane protein [Escherichia coli]|uniref:DedA family membrane protein n=1 Tax=Escherichia coli TaxID=562 RepID=A0A376ZH00_ECOLX|nr:DedA family membrane protein [Escherichia coli]